MGVRLSFVGQVGQKEYYLDYQGKLFWRVPDIREAIRVGPGHKVVAADYPSAELKLMTFLSQDKFMMETLNSGKEFMCSMISGPDLPYELVYEAYKNDNHPRHAELTKKRSNIKPVVYGIPLIT